MYAALEIDYHESDQDPTGEAFMNTRKVGASHTVLITASHFL